MITTLRLYLSAQAPHNGTSGIPTTKIRALKMPMNASRSWGATPISRRYVGRRAKIWLTPMPSTIEVTQKTASRIRQSWVGRAGAAGGAAAVSAASVMGTRGAYGKPTLTGSDSFRR